MTAQETKERIIEVLDKLPPDSLEGVLEYVEFVAELEKAEATNEACQMRPAAIAALETKVYK